MVFQLTVYPEYGYVIGTAFASSLLMTYFGIKVGQARTKYDVPYPAMYADRSECDKDKSKLVFNCIQRAHQNALETYPIFLSFLLVGGLKHPLIASSAGLIWILGRYIYAQGYYTGDPTKRYRGGFHILGLFAVQLCGVSLALSLLGFL